MFKYLKTLPERFVRWHERRKFKDSAEPWVSVIGDVEQDGNGIKLDVDWNDAFITYLRRKGVTGIREEDVIAHWITSLHASNLAGEE